MKNKTHSKSVCRPTFIAEVANAFYFCPLSGWKQEWLRRNKAWTSMVFMEHLPARQPFDPHQLSADKHLTAFI